VRHVKKRGSRQRRPRSLSDLEVFVLTRHAHSTLNESHRVNGDPTVAVPLTAAGREQARRLGDQIANLPIDLVVHTRFPRTRETAQIAMNARAEQVPFHVEPLLDDIDAGDLEGQPITDYRAWKRAHTRANAFPGGESLDDAARRYARAFAALAARPEQAVLVVCHEIPVRYALNAAAGSDDLDGPLHDIANATPYLFDASGLRRVAARIDELTSAAILPGSDQGGTR
jgi:broad specificity phosphatase PhoE